MGHEITDTDNIALYRTAAWHKLGTIVHEAKTPREMLYIAKLDWSVEQAALTASRERLLCGPDGEPVTSKENLAVQGWVANIRSDNGAVLGVVGEGFVPIQNSELASLIMEAASAEKVTTEVAGSLRGGREVFFLVHLGAFNIGRDHLDNFALFANGHAGSRALVVKPTMVRVVCANTMAAALAEGTRELRLRHTGGIRGRIDDIRKVLTSTAESVQRENDAARALASRRMSTAESDAFLVAAYEKLRGPIPGPDAREVGELSRRTRAIEAISSMISRRNHEQQVLGADTSAWLSANAVTGWIEHDKQTRTERVYTNLLGPSADAKRAVFELAATI